MFLFLSLISCSTNPVLIDQRLEIRDIDSAVEAVCISGNGRGQISFLSENHSFDFETVMDLVNGKWSLGVSLPFYGEEVMHIEYKQAYEGSNPISGNFASRIFEITQKVSSDYTDVLNKFLHNFALFLKFSSELSAKKHSCHRDNNEGYCKLISGDIFEYKFNSTRLEITFWDKNNLSFQLVFSHGQAGKFKRLRAYFENHLESGQKRIPLRLDLILENCSASH